MSEMTNECARCGAKLAEYQPRADLNVCLQCDRDICAESYRSVAAQVATLTAQRDEARAEVERVQALLATASAIARGYIPEQPTHPAHANDAATIAAIMSAGGIE